jgi:cytochrome c556
MRICCGVAMVLALAVAVGCGGNDPPDTPPATQPQAGAAQTAPAAPAPAAAPAGARAGGAGAQAAARVTPEQVEATMKGIAQANGALQKAVKGNMLAEAGTAAKQLATLFADVERFFKENNKADAVTLAQTARTGAMDVAAAAAAGDQTKAGMAAANIGGTCKQCHGLYREGDAATGFRIKAGTITP